MRRFRFILGIAAGLVCFGGMSARAAVLTYTFDPGTSFTLPDALSTSNVLTGSFTINTSTLSLSATDDVIIVGGMAAGTYAPLAFGGSISLDYQEIGDPSILIGVNFTPSLASAPQHATFTGVTWNLLGVPQPSLNNTGGATLIPEPSTWAMMLLGFAALGFLGYRQTRKGQAAGA
jgi:hypothetical protein